MTTVTERRVLNSQDREMRDNFPPRVVRVLERRAGHACSICDQLTSAPGIGPNDVLSDGEAAHITAAAPNGPRFDDSLSPEERRSVENGIWACTKHSGEIDSPGARYTVKELRAFKFRREERARESMRPQQEDRSAPLIELPYVRSAYRLFEIANGLEYTFGTTSPMRDIVRLHSAKNVLRVASKAIIDEFGTDPNVIGILSTLLSGNIALWEPSQKELSKLEALCSRAIDADDRTSVAYVEPLAFAMAAKGRPKTHSKIFERLVTDPKWRKADVARSTKYYGGVGMQTTAIIRHFNDPFRTGLLQVHDVGRLIDMALSSDTWRVTPQARANCADLLEKHAKVLSGCGETRLAMYVEKSAAVARFPRVTPSRYD